MALASNFANSMDNRNTLVERAISTIDNHNYGKAATNILKPLREKNGVIVLIVIFKGFCILSATIGMLQYKMVNIYM